MAEKEKMLAGEVYSAVDAQLLEGLAAAREVIYDYNMLRPSEKEKKLELLKSHLGHVGDDAVIKAADDAADLSWVPLREIYVERFGLRSIRQAVHRFLAQNC